MFCHVPKKAQSLLLLTTLCTIGLASTSEAQFEDPIEFVYTWEGEFDGDNFGFVNRTLGDVDNDGIVDIGIGVPGFAENGENSGKVYVYSGATGVLIRTHFGSAETDRFGYELGGVGDVTGDGHSDYVVCRPRTTNFQQYAGPGEAILFSGATGDSLKAWSTDVLGLGAAAQATGAGNVDSGGIGDVNNDGTPDILISALIAPGANGLAGKVHVISGADWDEILYTFEGEGPIHLFGFGIGGAGDLDFDGYDDVLVGAPNAGSGSRGRAYVFSGRTGEQFPYSPFEPDTTGAFFGFLFPKGAGDVNGDGYPDISVTDLQDSENGPFAGKAYVYSGFDGSLIHKFVGSGENAGFGSGRGCGDVDGDGHNDLLYCAFTDPTIATGAGTAFVLSGQDGTVLREIRCNLEGDSFGYSTLGVGDIDDDGALDFMISAINHDGAGTDRGKVYVIAGDIFPDPANVEPTDEGSVLSFPLELRVGPNPVREKLRASFALPHPSKVQVEVIDVAGARVRTLLDEERGEGRHTVAWDGRDAHGDHVPSGVYFVRVVSAGTEEVRSVVVR